MDPTTTLFTFLFQTDPSVRSVQLIGSWDNFSTPYTMRRDLRRGQDQWRGCYSFKDIVREDGSCPQEKRTGGLKMGHTYFYYYEVDASTETFDPSMPFTTACPYLPGQTVNTLTVPVERTLRNRSASTGSVRQENFRTMNPEAKFTNPTPVPSVPSRPEHTRRAASTSSFLLPRSPSRPVSPAPSWRRLFERKRGRSSENVPQKRQLLSSYDSDDNAPVFPAARETDSASTSTATLVSARGPPAREISPEALHRFLSEDMGSRSGTGATERPTLKIPDTIDDIDADDSDDEDNFAVSAVSESQSYLTRLSPPPFQRSASSDSISPSTALSPVQRPAQTTNLMTKSGPRWSISLASGASPTSEEEPLPLYELNDVNDSEDNDDNDEHNGLAPCLASPNPLLRRDTFRGYSLPRIGEETQKMASPGQSFAGFETPGMITRSGSEMSNGSSFLGGPIDTGLDDFVSEMGWIVDVIGTLSDN